MRSKQDITLKLDKNVIKQARTIAVRRGTSISKLLASYLESIVGEARAYDAARRKALAYLDGGFHLGGRIRCTRDELRER